MAHTKAAGKARQGTPRRGKRLGVKSFGGQLVTPGAIVIRQRGSTFHPSWGTRMGRDYTIYAVKEGKVNYRVLKGQKLVEVV